MDTENEAQKPNPALEPFAPFAGEWATVGTHPMVPGKTFHGRATFEWIEGGAFLCIHTQTDEPEIPSGISIIGSDDHEKKFYQLYLDERGISRKYDIAIQGRVMTSSRMSAGFSQRMVYTLSDDGNTIVSKGEMQRDAGAWEGDLELTFTRVL